jgi:hypothetical protein
MNIKIYKTIRSIKRDLNLIWLKFTHDNLEEFVLNYNYEVNTLHYILLNLHEDKETAFKNLKKAKENKDIRGHYEISCSLIWILQNISFYDVQLQRIGERYLTKLINYTAKKSLIKRFLTK